MNNGPQLIIFEPNHSPRKIILNVDEDSVEQGAIFDENGDAVTNYNTLFNEEDLSVPLSDNISAYIKNWESQGNAISEKKEKKIKKRKRLQELRLRQKERNKQRKAMKSLLHCAFDRTPSINSKNLEEEREILKAMKTKHYNLKDILKIKPNRIIPVNTNICPYENSVIDLRAKRKHVIDTVNLDSDESSDDDNICINIDVPHCNRARSPLSRPFYAANPLSASTPSSTSNKRNNQRKKVDVVQISDSSDSDVEYVSVEEEIESVDDSEDEISTPKNFRSSDLYNPPDSTNNVQELNQSVDDNMEELASMVDSFVDKIIQQDKIPSFVNLHPETPNSSFPRIISVQSMSKHVSFNDTISENVIPDEVDLPESRCDDDLLEILESPKHNENHDSEEDVENCGIPSDAEDPDLPDVSGDPDLPDVSEDYSDEEVSIRDRYDPDRFDSVPSPDYTPTEDLHFSATDLRDFGEFLRQRNELRERQGNESDFCGEVEEEPEIPVVKIHEGKSPLNRATSEIDTTCNSVDDQDIPQSQPTPAQNTPQNRSARNYQTNIRGNFSNRRFQRRPWQRGFQQPIRDRFQGENSQSPTPKSFLNKSNTEENTNNFSQNNPPNKRFFHKRFQQSRSTDQSDNCRNDFENPSLKYFRKIFTNPNESQEAEPNETCHNQDAEFTSSNTPCRKWFPNQRFNQNDQSNCEIPQNRYQCCQQPFKKRYHPEPYEESKFHHGYQSRPYRRPRYHPEPYEEDKFNPTPFNQRRIQWRVQNPQFQNHFRNNFQRQYRNYGDSMDCTENAVKQRAPNHGNRFPRNQLAHYQNRPFNQPDYNFNSPMPPNQTANCSNQVSTPQETLFTRRDKSKLQYKANISDFESCDQQSNCYPSMQSGYNAQDDLLQYESNVAKKLRSCNSNNDSNTFSWENNTSLDFVPINMTKPTAASPPWANNELSDSGIQAISRRQWINANMKL